MRVIAVLGVGVLALAACSKKEDKSPAAEASASGGNASATAGPVAMPKRKPGLWSHTVSSSGSTQAMQICIDEDTDAKMSVWGQAVSKDMCSKNSFAAAPGGYAFESECDLGGDMGHVVSKGAVTGDFNSAYTVKTTSTTTGAAMAQANGTTEMTLTAKWEGACPAGMKGGDITLPGGMKINMEAMTAKK
ncbi:MAG: DUF3617 family protein [Phenylobacterium sp.]|uniref:DUF3617 domain-containing protein n=1 Tax=Phenylobacterium sp. TaxID=1871053 RepID=UPI0011F49FCB|nr:DUF3617 family protein [Phenylobacterium sp.]TAJ69866.1 MAG: DUF3617 family protein [Phenylobacterium sp.]